MSNLTSPVSNQPDPVIKVGDKEYTVSKFVLAKVLRATNLITKLIEESQLASSLGTMQNEQLSSVLLKQLPSLLEKAEPYVLQFCALTLMSNAKLRELTEADESVDAYLKNFADNELKWNGDYGVEQIVETIVVGIEQVGIQAVRKNFPRLQKVFQEI